MFPSPWYATITAVCAVMLIQTSLFATSIWGNQPLWTVCYVGSYMFAVTFYHFTFECNRGLRSMIFYDVIVISVCDSRHSLSSYVLLFNNLIRHHTNRDFPMESCCSLAFWITSGLNSEGFLSKREYCCNIFVIQCWVSFHSHCCCILVSLLMQQLFACRCCNGFPAQKAVVWSCHGVCFMFLFHFCAQVCLLFGILLIFYIF